MFITKINPACDFLVSCKFKNLLRKEKIQSYITIKLIEINLLVKKQLLAVLTLGKLFKIIQVLLLDMFYANFSKKCWSKIVSCVLLFKIQHILVSYSLFCVSLNLLKKDICNLLLPK